MKLKHHLFPLLLATCGLLAGGSVVAAEAAPKSSFSEATRAAEHLPGFFDVWRDAQRGRVLLGVRELNEPFLMIVSLPWSLGSNDIGLDRGQSGEAQLVEFRRAGERLLLVELNTKFRAATESADEALSVRQAFPESVLWSGRILAEQGGAEGRLLVDFGDFLTSDRHGVARRLAFTQQGRYEVDAARSAVLPEDARSFPDNTELEALLTFQGPGEGRHVREVAMDAHSFSLRQHLSLVRLPPPGFAPRPYHPASGGLSVGWLDYAQPLAASLDQRVQPRFRLQHRDPAARSGEVLKPIVFYVDRGAPEPVRRALLEGASWWAASFAKAGFENAYRVELLPEGADPMDVRYSLITWAHRRTRGWSYGQPIVDPRTGEIIKGAVTLGSQRVRQDILIAETLLAPYDKPNSAELAGKAEQMALARLRQLAAHEVGHALGFAHNFSASRHGNGSVMDYPHPLLKLEADGSVSLGDAYGVGTGPWDDFIVAHAYGEFAPGGEAAALARLRADIARAGYGYIADQDARAPGDAERDGLLWDFGADPLAAFDSLLRIRAVALANFSRGVLPPDRQAGEIEARLVPLYLLHRYQSEAVARLIGGVSYRYAEAGEGPLGAAPVEAATQRAAIERLVSTLGAEQLALPANVLDLVTPPGNEYRRGREYFATGMAPLFDPLAAAEAAAAQTSEFLFAPERVNRLAWQHARDPAMPGVGELLEATFRASWQHRPPGLPSGAAAVQEAANWVVLESLLHSLNGEVLHPQVAARMRLALAGWAGRLQRGADSPSRSEAAGLIERFLADPAAVKLRAPPTIPPGAPI